MNVKRWTPVLLGLGAMGFFFAFNPMQIYNQPSSMAGLLFIPILFGSPLSEWARWQGALPFDRHRWLLRAMAVESGGLLVILTAFCGVLGVIRVGISAPSSSWGLWATMAVATWCLASWRTVLSLRSPQASWGFFLGFLPGGLVFGLWITVVLTVTERTSGPLGPVLAVVGDAASFGAAWFWGLRRLRRGDQ